MKAKSFFGFVLILICMAGLAALVVFGIPVRNADGNETRILSAGNIRQGLDLQGGVSILYEADIPAPTDADMAAAQALLRGRLDLRGYLEADAVVEGNRQIRVDIPGVDNPREVSEQIGRAGRLEFRDMEGNVLLTGANVSRATRMFQDGRFIVALSFDAEGTELFAEATRANIGRPIGIYLDDVSVSGERPHPTVRSVITDGNAIIEGDFSPDDALEMARTIQQGALPFGLNPVMNMQIGARLGADALNSSVVAGAVGLLLVLLFMAFFYKTMGFCADMALVIYVCLVLLIVSGFQITLSLPGIAGLILSIGMATDANIVIFERIREEVAMGKSLRSAMRTGYKRALPAIVDSNVTTLIAGFVLLFLGTGPIMGFAQMLIIGILVSMFTCLIVTRYITVCLMELGLVKPRHIISKKQQQALADARARNLPEPDSGLVPKPVVEKRKLYFAISAFILTAGLAFSLFHWQFGDGFFNLGVEFTSGTSYLVEIGRPFENAEVEEIVRGVTGESAPIVQQVQGAGMSGYSVMVRTAQVSEDSRIALIDALSARFGLTDDDFEYSSVSASVSEAMRRSAVLAVVVASVLMLAYISLRFRDVRTGSSAVLAQFHDALVVLCIYAVLRIPLTNAFIAVMLTTLGYSINATIIIFDRIRENKARMPKAAHSALINTSVTQTLRRTLFSTISSFVAVFMLYVIGVAAIRDFTLPIMVGLLFGAYSSVLLSGSMWYMMLKGKKAAKQA